MNIVQEICNNTHKQKHKQAILFYKDGVRITITYQDLFNSIKAYANIYTKAGIQKDDLVLIFMKHHQDLYGAFFGAIAIGAVPAFMPCPSEKQDHAKYWQSHQELFKIIKPKCIVSHNQILLEMKEQELLSQGLIVINIDDDNSGQFQDDSSLTIIDSKIAFLQHSSGTTGLKKGVMLSHKAVVAQIESYKQVLNISGNEVFASWLPVYHDMGLISCTVMPLVLGLTVCVIDPFEWVAKPWLLFDVIENNKAHYCWLPNFAFKHLVRTVRLAKKSYNLSSMIAFINCSESCKKETFDEFYQEFEAFGVKVESLQTCYAMAETVFAVSQTDMSQVVKSIYVSSDELEFNKEVFLVPDSSVVEPNVKCKTLLSCGKVILGLDVVILDEQYQILSENRVGQIAIRGDFIFEGYYKREDITKERFHNGWYLTKDNGFFHGGELYITGRVDDLMIIHGRNYYAHEVELHLIKVNNLKAGRAVAFAIYNKISESEEAYIIAEVEHSLEQSLELKKQIKQIIFDEMGLDVFHVGLRPLGWLVKTTSGKISRKDNKEKFLIEQNF